MKSSNSTMMTVVLAVFMLILSTSAAAPLSTKLPPSLTISKVQEAIQSASSMENDNRASPKLDIFLEHLKETSSYNTEADPMNKNDGLDGLIHFNKNNEVAVDVLGKISSGETLESVLREKGYRVSSCFMKTRCSVYLRVDQLDGIAKLPEVLEIHLALPNRQPSGRKIRPSDTRRTVLRNTHGRDLQGSVLSEAVRAMFVDTARSRYENINGTGITVGILSDSFDCDGNQTLVDIETGDLPPLSRINVLADYFEEGCIDEGRAMMQLVYDIAPGANFAFRTAVRGQADFAAGIIALADAGCQVIVDDIGYYDEPFFQDGIITLAINEVTSRGVYYFTAQSNFANNAWDGKTGFTDSGIKAYNGTFHSFGLDKNGSHVVLQPFSSRKRSFDAYFLFQWDEPFISPKGTGGSRSDVDIYVFDENGKILSTRNSPNIGSDPYEVIAFNTMNVSTIVNSTTVIVYVAIVLKNGPPPTYMKIISDRTGRFNFSTGTEGTNWGHSNSASAASVGASFYNNTPAYGVSPPIVETFSSYGGIPTFFDADSNRLLAPEIRQQPRFTGPDGVSNTFFSPPDKIFFGTSASAPNVAAVAALMLQLQAKSITKITPKTLFQILESTAIDMTSTVGFDFITGYGFVNASSALDAVSAMIVTKAPTKSPTDSPTKSPTDSPTKSPTDSPTKSPTAAPVSSPTKCGLFGFNFFCPARSECGFFRRLFKVNGC